MHNKILAQTSSNASVLADEADLNANERSEQGIDIPMEDIGENIALRTTVTEIHDEDVCMSNACRLEVHGPILLPISRKKKFFLMLAQGANERFFFRRSHLSLVGVIKILINIIVPFTGKSTKK